MYNIEMDNCIKSTKELKNEINKINSNIDKLIQEKNELISKHEKEQDKLIKQFLKENHTL
jgi:hypothetical protein